MRKLTRKEGLYKVARLPPGEYLEKFQVSKLSKDLEPLEDYTVHIKARQRFYRCSCFSRFTPCKHAGLIAHITLTDPTFEFGYFTMEPHAVNILPYDLEDFSDLEIQL